MEKDMDHLDRIARRRAGAKLGFYIHAAVFTKVNLGLFAINAYFTPSHTWYVWPLAGWGIGLAFHCFAVFFAGSGSRLRKSMIEQERHRLEAENLADRR
jgi:hypothetical protein